MIVGNAKMYLKHLLYGFEVMAAFEAMVSCMT